MVRAVDKADDMLTAEDFKRSIKSGPITIYHLLLEYKWTIGDVKSFIKAHSRALGQTSDFNDSGVTSEMKALSSG